MNNLIGWLLVLPITIIGVITESEIDTWIAYQKKQYIYSYKPNGYQVYVEIRYWLKYSYCLFVGHKKEYIGFKMMPDWICKRCGYVCEPYQRIDIWEERFRIIRKTDSKLK